MNYANILINDALEIEENYSPKQQLYRLPYFAWSFVIVSVTELGTIMNIIAICITMIYIIPALILYISLCTHIASVAVEIDSETLLSEEEKKYAVRTANRTVGIICGIVLVHNVGCFLVGTNCKTSLLYFLS